MRKITTVILVCFVFVFATASFADDGLERIVGGGVLGAYGTGVALAKVMAAGAATLSQDLFWPLFFSFQR